MIESYLKEHFLLLELYFPIVHPDRSPRIRASDRAALPVDRQIVSVKHTWLVILNNSQCCLSVSLAMTFVV